MPTITDIWILHTTARLEDAESDGSFAFEIQSQGQHAVLDLPSLPHNEREQGRTDEYHLDLRNFQFDDQRIAPGEIRITARSDDGWLPATMWVVSKNVRGDFKLLIHRPEWPQNRWFDTDAGRDRQPSIALDQP